MPWDYKMTSLLLCGRIFYLERFQGLFDKLSWSNLMFIFDDENLGKNLLGH